MNIEFVQSWRYNRDSGYKAWYGFVVLSDRELITFTARGKNAERATSAGTNRPSDTAARYVTDLIDDGKAKKLKRFDRDQIETVGAVPNAQRLAITTRDGEQHLIKHFPFADELERVAERLAVALFHRALGEETTMSAMGSGMKAPMMGALGTSVLVGGGLILLALIGEFDESARSRWIVEAVESIPLAASITIGLIIMVIGLAFTLYRAQVGYVVTNWRPDEELLADR